MERTSGVLLHISSLPNKFGIGSFGQSAYDFVDFLVQSGQTYWQILPLTTTSYGDSPYQSFSAFAGNTHFIDFDLLVKDGYLKDSDFAGVDFGQDPENIDYGLIFNVKRPILETAVKNFLNSEDIYEFKFFVEKNESWLEPFAEYMAIKEHFGLVSWDQWDEDIRYRDEDALEKYRMMLAKEMNFHRVTQFFFFKQWNELKSYANKQNIQIIGDMPIYVAGDSVEMWSTPQFFKVDSKKRPTVIAGTPPDNFSEDGQFWGNPIYDWEYMKRHNFDWWVTRMEESFKLYDVVRIDHFRGFESYWEVPADAKTSASGKWAKGPGIALFDTIQDRLGNVKIIAEDLGFMTQEVIDMREGTGYPGMRILQFGFSTVDSVDLPHHYVENSVAYVGTHDNETALGWYKDSASPEVQAQVNRYLHRHDSETVSQALNRGIAASPSYLAVYTMQDLLNLDNSARMNTPSTIGINWKWRMLDNAITDELARDLYALTDTYFRLNVKNQTNDIITEETEVSEPNEDALVTEIN
ncbi:4-alpha-glucanotransferase [Aerococcaceae bacterium WS4759]|uniref:4-alpha-glucanotransferase n=1 Tax=Fundicoccus ignavus TaxID=2664442 RepID=A0A6I2GM12_9LACT|nr:4-alpha-glucanotransferase [Fundicoccus ignavus]MRI85538.1 4-alpha-glucanotransferase [Fundicoccus ignavus]